MKKSTKLLLSSVLGASMLFGAGITEIGRAHV